jgi:hypothetical protein
MAVAAVAAVLLEQLAKICGPAPRMVKMGDAACSEPDPEESSMNIIKRVVVGLRTGFLHQAMRGRPRVRLPHADPDTGGGLVHDG